jgi:hypothetical protein
MNQEHHEKDVRTFSLGATYDLSKELNGAENKGTYFDGENVRVSSDRGNKGDAEKIRGEELEHAAPFPGDWFQLLSPEAISINDDVFELWVEENGADSPYIVINGEVMGKSPNMPWVIDYPIQFDINPSCVGGEVFLTDFQPGVAPVIFNIEDIKDNFIAGTDKYFAAFNLNLYTINLASPLDIPVFMGLVLVGGGGGLPAGDYQYSLRYVNEDGDATNHGQLTPPIPVVQSLSPASLQYPSSKTYGGAPNLVAVTSYGPKLRFRVTNLNNYDYIEIRRIAYNTGGGINFVPAGTIVAKIPILPGEISIREFIDPVDSNIEGLVLADNEEATQLSAIDSAKGIRYHDKRLVLANYRVASMTASITFNAYNTKKILPIIKNLGREGFKDPINHTYHRNYPSGEKYSIGVVLFDGSGGQGFVSEDDDLKNILVPNRRDPMDSDSVDLSIGLPSTAATVDSTVTETFEIFDHETAVKKTDKNSFKNILDRTLLGFKSQGNVNQFSPDAGYGGTVNSSEIGYLPYRPTDANDDTSGHNYVVNPEVEETTTNHTYSPQGFGCNYISKGFALGGVSNLPSWAKSFSVVRSDRAGRVICQGVGMYSMTPADFNLIGNAGLGGKNRNKFWFHSPDIESGVINQAIIDDINTNPQNYSVQFVSPLGFFSELYNFENNLLANDRDRVVDMMLYARVLHDEGQMNPGESGTMGIGSGASRFVAYNRYRNSNNAGQGAFNVAEGGNKEFALDGFNVRSDGRSTYYELVTQEQVYNVSNTGGVLERDFNDQGLKDWTEPIYIINIIQNGASVSDLNINSYRSTGHYQKVESIIGLGTGLPDQSFLLVDERWEDCIPSLDPAGFNAAGESFIYLRDDQNNERVFLNTTYYSVGQVTTVLTDIFTNGEYVTPGGVSVVGIYNHHQDSNGDIFVDFNYSGTIPLEDERVIVRYDSSRPIVFFGGDTVVSENVFSPIDKEADATDDPDSTNFPWGIGLPYRKFVLNPRHYIVEDTTGIDNSIQTVNTASLGYLRQLMVMYCSESVISSNFAFNGARPLHYFPLTHYIMRPNRFSDNEFGSGDPAAIASDNNLFSQYFDDYPAEWELWKFGGFRFDTQFNIDYSAISPVLFFSKPKVGYEEQNHFCTGHKWSLPRATNQQDSPGLKTFPASNTFIADDDNGCVKKLWDCKTDLKGHNLYSICSKGIILLLTKKSILSNLNADDLTVMSSDSFIQDQYLISKVGSNDEMWRGMSEASILIKTEDGDFIEREALFLPNSKSVYRLMDDQVKDIAKDNYIVRLSPSLKAILPGYQTRINGHYDSNHNEYWLQMPDADDESIQKCFVYAQDTGYFVGRFRYSFDKYVMHQNENYGFRDGEMHILDRGFIINGDPIVYRLIQNTSPQLTMEKEAISISVNTGPRGEMKPTEIIFMDEELNVLSVLNQAIFGPLYLKQYDGWWNQVPCKDISVSIDRDRIQYRLILYEINHTFEEDFKVVSSVLQYKVIK